MNESRLDNITLDCTNLYKEISMLLENLGNGIIYGSRVDFFRRVYTLHRDFHKRALVILSNEEDNSFDIKEYGDGVRKERRDLAEIYTLNKSSTLCALIKRKIYGGSWGDKVVCYMSMIIDDWTIDQATNRVIYYPIEEENISNSEQSPKDVGVE